MDENEKNKYDLKNLTISNGAIRTNTNFYSNWNNDLRFYEGLLTIFYRHKHRYISLHNGKQYYLLGEDYCKNLVPLRSVLPKVSYEVPKYISAKQGVKLFDRLFNKDSSYSLGSLYNKDLHNLADFYIGNLAFCHKVLSHDTGVSKNIHIEQRYLLQRSDAGLVYITSKESQDKEYDYLHYNCLFLKQRNGWLYNTHNFELYTTGILEQKHVYDCEVGNDYFDWMTSLKEIIEEKNISYKSNQITIPKALKLYRKIK